MAKQRKRSSHREIPVSTAAARFIKGRNLLIGQAVKKLNSLNWSEWTGDYMSFCKAQIKIKEEIQALKRDIQFANNMVARDEEDTKSNSKTDNLEVLAKQKAYEMFGIN